MTFTQDTLLSNSRKQSALLIGVSEYEFPGASSLPACNNDVGAINSALQQECYFDATNIINLKGTVSSDDFQSALESLSFTDADKVVLYFSGHGKLVNNNEVYIVLSDKAISANSIVEHCRKTFKSSWIIFDMCHAGAVQVELDPFKELTAKAGEGCVVFASCTPEMQSYIDSDSQYSAFTDLLITAMRIARPRNGVKTLSDIERALYCLVKQRNQKKPNHQQPLFIHSSVGSISFYDPYHVSYKWNPGQLPETEHFVVKEVKPCFADRKRYSCKITAKLPMSRELIIKDLPRLISLLKEYEIYNTEHQQNLWENKGTQVLFIYFAENEDNFNNSLFSYRATWSDLGENEKLGLGEWNNEIQCWIYKQWSSENLNEMRKIYERGSVSDDVLIKQAQVALTEITTCASELFYEGDRWLGGLTSTDEFAQIIEANQDHLENSLDLALKIGFPSPRLKPLGNQIIDLAGALRDLPLFFLGKGRIGRSEENLQQCFRVLRNRYDNARMKIAEITEQEI